MPKPSVKIAPLEQAKELYSNVSDYNNNLLSIFTNLGGFTKDIITSPAPCEMSKFLTDQVCKINQKTISLANLDFKLGLLDFKKIKELTTSSINITKNLLSSSSNTSVGGQLKELDRNITEINKLNNRNKQNMEVLEELRKSQKGGGNKEQYNYIINPKTNRKVNIYGKTGQSVLRSYIEYMR